LAAGIGNLVARIITLAEKFKIKNQKLKTQIKNQKIKNEIEKTRRNWRKSLEEFKFNEALISIWELISFCDKYIEKEKPWELLKSKIKRQKSKVIISDLLTALDNIAQLLQPFLPETSEKIFEQIKTKKSKLLFPRV
jgi:methionyl-tRNA synthetase